MKVTHGLESGTQSIHTVPWIHKTHRFVLIDTPGFDDTYRTSYEILELIARFLQDSYVFSPVSLICLLIQIKI